MLITDGIPSSEDDVFQEHNQPHKVRGRWCDGWTKYLKLVKYCCVEM